MSKIKKLSLVLMAIFYTGAGINHFVSPQNYVRIMPPFFPAPLVMVYVSGVAEALLGILLLVPKFRRLAAWGIIALLIAVFPANIYMYLQGEAVFHVPQIILLIRLPFQFVLMGWAYWYTRREN